MAKNNKQADQALAQMVQDAQVEETFTLQQIAAKTGLSAERVRQIEAQAIKKLRQRLKTFAQAEGFDIS
jgi:DNA-directed RNA polymerase sigma subunit (sigma70/sigma32)